jgi:hypothetical protein
VKDAPHPPASAPRSISIVDLFTDALMHRINTDDKPWRGRGRHAKAKRLRARAKRAKGRVVNGIRKHSNRKPF